MSLGKQWQVIKHNWLISIIILVLFILILSNSSNLSSVTSNYNSGISGSSFGGRGIAESSPSSLSSSSKSILPPINGGGVAPQTTDRSIVKTSYLSSKTARGEFDKSADQAKAIVKAANGFVLYENVYVSGELQREQSKHGSYQLRVPVSSYSSVITQLKLIGKTQSFTENAEDVTDQKVSLQTELDAEKARLERYNQLLKETTDTNEKINLIDKIFDQERTVSSIEDSLKNVGEQVTYATISLNLDEAQSDYSGVILVKFSDLVSTIVSSFNGMILFVLGILPWAVLVGIIWLIVRWIRNR